jgi:hypothetical protein
MKCIALISLIITAFIASCKTKTDSNRSTRAGIENKSVLINGIEYSISDVKQCSYPANDLMIEKKKNKKLVLVRMQVHCTETINKNELAPHEAELIDSKGNSYANSPAIIAIAQNNGCIKGDDIKSYNAIWNGIIKKNETETAWVLGFEIPVNANPEKLYWNINWKNNNLFFLFQQTDYAINH